LPHPDVFTANQLAAEALDDFRQRAKFSSGQN
jgi:hypothetical protein